MIVRITLVTDKNEEIIMLFGNSYKDWFDQFNEYIWNHIRWWDEKTIMKCEIIHILRVERSNSRWKGWGGLKWCSHEYFQEQLNREGVQDNEPDNPKPRIYANMEFNDALRFQDKCQEFLYKRMRHLAGLTAEQIGKALQESEEQLTNKNKPNA